VTGARPSRLLWIKGLHTGVWAVFAACVLAIPALALLLGVALLLFRWLAG